MGTDSLLGITGLTAAYLLLGLLLLNLCLYSRWTWQVKAAAILLTTCFYILTYLSWKPLLGWPTEQQLPQLFKLAGARVEQPDKISGAPGVIYLWVIGPSKSDSQAAPRAYRLPYSEALYEAVLEATKKMENGLPQMGRLREPEGNIAETRDRQRTTRTEIPIEFSDVPDPLFPEDK